MPGNSSPDFWRGIPWHSNKKAQKNTNSKTNNYQKLIHAQNKIGWHQLLKGRITHDFVINHDTYANLNGHKMDGEQWSSKLIQSLWNYVLSLWKHRNDTLHASNTSSPWHNKNLQDQVKALYNQKPHIDPSDQHALNKPLHTVLKYTNKQMERWLTITRPRVKAALQRTKTRTVRQSIAISTYFTQPHQVSEAISNLKQRIKTTTTRKQRQTSKPHTPLPTKQNQNSRNQLPHRDKPITDYFQFIKHNKDTLKPP